MVCQCHTRASEDVTRCRSSDAKFTADWTDGHHIGTVIKYEIYLAVKEFSAINLSCSIHRVSWSRSRITCCLTAAYPRDSSRSCNSFLNCSSEYLSRGFTLAPPAEKHNRHLRAQYERALYLGSLLAPRRVLDVRACRGANLAPQIDTPPPVQALRGDSRARR